MINNMRNERHPLQQKGGVVRNGTKALGTAQGNPTPTAKSYSPKHIQC